MNYSMTKFSLLLVATAAVGSVFTSFISTLQIDTWGQFSPSPNPSVITTLNTSPDSTCRYPSRTIDTINSSSTYDLTKVNNTTLNLPRGLNFSLSVHANSGVGDQWLVTFDNRTVELLDNNFYYPESCHGVGADSTEVFDFRPLKDGNSTIHFGNNYRGMGITEEMIVDIKIE